MAMLPASNAPTLSPHEAQVELDGRRAARRNLLAYCGYVNPQYETQHAHVRLLAAKLQQVALYIASGGKQGIGRLMIFMPPQHGKSEIASRMFPAWILGNMPNIRVILTSYGESLATYNSRMVRDQITSEYYQAIFGTRSILDLPVELSADSKSVEGWDLARPYRGGLKAAGVGGGITGLPAHLFIIDDPFKNREEGESESRRDLVDDWYKSAARTRLRPNGAVVIFHTRWHQDDLAGRLLQRMVSDPMASQWDVVCMPALALDAYPANESEQRKKMREGVYLPLKDPLGRKAGAALCGAWYDEKYLLGTKADVGLYEFESLFQQSPFAKQGNMFKREWFEEVPNGPGNHVYARLSAWDKAATSGGGARSSRVVISWGRDDYIYIEHVWKDQVSSAERERKMIELGLEDYKTYGAHMIVHPQDPGSAGVDSAQATNSNLADHGLYGFYEQVTGDKETNAGPLASKAQAGRVRLVSGGWNDEYLDEAAAFPKSRYKDQMDASSTGFNKLRAIVEAIKQAEQDDDDDDLVYEERVKISPV
jgi:hypothetical protein